MSLNPQLESKLRQSFKYFNLFMVLLWRLGLGGWLNVWPHGLGRYLVITHIGRKSGRRRRTPVNYAEVDGDLYCTAGFGHISDWYQNIKINPSIEVWLPDGWWTALAEEVFEPALRRRMLRQVIINSGFAGPLFGVNALTMTDEQFDAVTRDYRLLRLRRVAQRTGPGGPGDLAGVWPLAVLVLLPLALRRRRS